MLAAADEEGFSDVVSWLPDNKSFKVFDKTRFVNEIMPKHFFKASKYKSFQRVNDHRIDSNSSTAAALQD